MQSGVTYDGFCYYYHNLLGVYDKLSIQDFNSALTKFAIILKIHENKVH